MRQTMLPVSWAAHAADVGLADYPWAVGMVDFARAGIQADAFDAERRPTWVLAWGRWAGAAEVPAGDVAGCEDGLSWHHTAEAVAAALGRAADCHGGGDREALRRLASEVRAAVEAGD